MYTFDAKNTSKLNKETAPQKKKTKKNEAVMDLHKKRYAAPERFGTVRASTATRHVHIRLVKVSF